MSLSHDLLLGIASVYVHPPFTETTQQDRDRILIGAVFDLVEHQHARQLDRNDPANIITATGVIREHTKAIYYVAVSRAYSPEEVVDPLRYIRETNEVDNRPFTFLCSAIVLAQGPARDGLLSLIAEEWSAAKESN